MKQTINPKTKIMKNYTKEQLLALTCDEYHSLVSNWISVNNLPNCSLDEIDLDDFTPEQRKIRDLFLDVFYSTERF